MKRLTLLCVLFLLIVCPGLLAQSQGTAPGSLGDLARQLNSDRAQAAKKPTKVFTNDDMPARPPEASLTSAGGMASTPSASATTQAPSAPPGKFGGGPEARDEKYYRQKMGELQAKLEMHQRQLEVLQQKTAQNQMQYYPDPNKTLLQEYSRSDVTNLTKRIQAKQAEIDADQKSIDDLRDQLRRAGGDPGWLRGSFPAPSLAAAAQAEEKTAESPGEGKTQGGGNAEDKKKSKEFWQSQFKAGRDLMAKAQEQQQLLEDEINLLRVQQARETSPDVQNDVSQKIAARTPALDAARATTQKAQKLLDDLDKAFKASGAPADWGKTD